MSDLLTIHPRRYRNLWCLGTRPHHVHISSVTSHGLLNIRSPNLYTLGIKQGVIVTLQSLSVHFGTKHGKHCPLDGLVHQHDNNGSIVISRQRMNDAVQLAIKMLECGNYEESK